MGTKNEHVESDYRRVDAMIPDVAETWKEPAIINLICPVCGSDLVRTGKPYVLGGQNSTNPQWEGKGDLVAVPFVGKCGHRWEVRYGQTNGSTVGFISIDAANQARIELMEAMANYLKVTGTGNLRDDIGCMISEVKSKA